MIKATKEQKENIGDAVGTDGTLLFVGVEGQTNEQGFISSCCKMMVVTIHLLKGSSMLTSLIMTQTHYVLLAVGVKCMEHQHHQPIVVHHVIGISKPFAVS